MPVRRTTYLGVPGKRSTPQTPCGSRELGVHREAIGAVDLAVSTGQAGDDPAGVASLEPNRQPVSALLVERGC
jgi:hypothetical protein